MLALTKKRFRAILSSILIICLLISAITAPVLFFGKTGVFLSISRRIFINVHVVCGAVMLIAGLAHCLVNMKVYISQLKSLLKKDRQ